MTQLNKIKRMQQLAGLITEGQPTQPQAESQLYEALNKDIKAFGQDLDKRFKEAGFDTLVLMQPATPEQLNIVKTKEKAVLFEVSQTPESQMLILKVNPKMVSKAESIINKFQLSDYNGPILKKGWTSKQVQGAINPGDIVNQKMDHSRGEWYFYRLAKVDTKIKQVESIEQAVNEALKSVREVAPAAPAAPAAKQTSDVASLTKMISTNTSLINKLKTVNNGKEVTETLLFILNNINPKVSGVNKTQLKSIIDQRFK